MAASNYPNGKDSHRDDVIREQAINWLLRQREGAMGADEWEAFSDWLAADERRRPFFDELAEADASLDDIAIYLGKPRKSVPPPPANDNLFRRFAPLWGGAVAAALIAVVLVMRPSGVTEFRNIETAPGEQRVVALQDSVTMTLNSATEVEVAENEPTVRFSHGEAAFEIAGVEPSSLRVEVADLVLTDHGTVFNVILDQHSLRVAVAEGTVEARSADATMLIEAGQQLEKPLDGGAIIRRSINNDTLLSWRDRRLEFENAPVVQVVADVGRNLGQSIAVSDRLADEQLTGTVGLSGNEQQVLSDLALLLGGRLRKEGDGWRIE